MLKLKNKNYYTITEISRILGMSRQNIHVKMKKKEFSAIRVGQEYIVEEDEVNKIKRHRKR